MTEDDGNNLRRQNYMLTRNAMRSRRFGLGPSNRDVFRADHMEGRELWDLSKKTMRENQHSQINDPAGTTLGTYVGTSLIRVPESIPANTFKERTYPHTFTTLSYEENAEPDTAKLLQNLSPLEFAAMGQMMHAVPPKLQEGLKRPHTYTENLDAVVTGRRKWRTGDTLDKHVQMPFQPYTRTSTNMSYFRGARQNFAKNKTQLAGNETDYKTETQQEQKVAGLGAMFTHKNAEKIRNLGTRMLGSMAADLVGSGGDVQGAMSKAFDRFKDSSEVQELVMEGISRTELFKRIKEEMMRTVKGMIPRVSP